MSARFRCLLLVLGSVGLPFAAFGHRLDEYLQATLVAIEPGDIHLQINLTPGVTVADRVLAMIDRDRDGAISTNEAMAYAELLKRDLALRVDGRNLELKVTRCEFPGPDEFRAGVGIIQMEFSARPGSLPGGRHTLAFENRHQGQLSVYLFNAAKPESATIQILRQNRDDRQSRGEIEFSVFSQRHFHGAGWIVALMVVMLAAFSARAYPTRSRGLPTAERAQ